MASMAVLTVGVLGLMHMTIYSAQSTGVGRKRTLAVELARDLVEQIDRWSVTDGRLLPATGLATPRPALSTVCSYTVGTGGSTSCTLPTSVTALPKQANIDNTIVDHVEADLVANATYQGIHPLPSGFERYYNIYPLDFDANGTTDVFAIVVFVRFWLNGEPQDVALTTTKVNSSEIVRGGVL
jgi:hypothetical protein